MYENMVEICYHNDFGSWFRIWDEFYVLHGRDVRKTTKEIIEDAINNPEFVKRLAKAFDLWPCVLQILECDDIIALETLKETILEDRINQLNIQHWFERLN